MKKLIYIFILIQLYSAAYSQIFKFTMTPVDRTALQVYAGTVISLGVTTITYCKTKNTFVSLATGFLSGVIAGAAKELIYNTAMKRGTPGQGDFSSTAWGAVIAIPISRIAIDIHEKKELHKEYYELIGDSIRLKNMTPRDSALISYLKTIDSDL